MSGIELSAATGLVFHHSNIGNFDAVIPIMAGMKRKSKERLDAVIHILEEEENEFCIGYKKVHTMRENICKRFVHYLLP